MTQESQRRTHLLTGIADILFVPMLFHILTQWDKMTSWAARLLWFGLFILVKNELMSVRDSYRCYSVPLYLLDVLSLLIYLFAVQALTKSVPLYGYDPAFWFCLSALWGSYSIWDIVMFNRESDVSYKEKLKLWSIYMAVACVMTFACALLLTQIATDLSTTTNVTIFYVAQIVPGGFIVYAVICWLVTIRAKFDTTTPPSGTV